MKKFYIFFLLLMVLGGCIASPPEPNRDPGSEDFSKGRRYFLRECGRCHGLIYPEERSRAEWQGILARKRGKVSLTTAQFDSLAEFVLATAGN